MTGPDGTKDAAYETYIKVDDEIMKFTGISGSSLTGAVRGSLGTTAATHSSGAAVKTFYRLTGNSIDLALKVMLSGWGTFFKTGVAVTHFNYISATETDDNAIYFDGVNVSENTVLRPGTTSPRQAPPTAPTTFHFR